MKASTSHNPSGLHGLLQGYLYLLTITILGAFTLFEVYGSWLLIYHKHAGPSSLAGLWCVSFLAKSATALASVKLKNCYSRKCSYSIGEQDKGGVSAAWGILRQEDVAATRSKYRRTMRTTRKCVGGLQRVGADVHFARTTRPLPRYTNSLAETRLTLTQTKLFFFCHPHIRLSSLFRPHTQLLSGLPMGLHGLLQG
jgi:hypothetical protein